jgi:photosystem II stability/assembly factor-like uncharacterized protein
MRNFLLGVSFFAAVLASAQTTPDPNVLIQPELLSNLKYRHVGPSRGGRATAITGVRQEPFTFYFGATGGGVWRSNDAGTNWENISDGQIKCGSIGAVAIAPSDPAVIYVGTGSACPRGNISAGIGVYRSTDKGKTWNFIGLPKSGMIGKIEVHPSNPDVAFVAALGNPFGPNPERGVYRTSDGGKKWEQVHTMGDSTGCVDLVMDPSNPRIIYAAMWRAERKPWTLHDGGKKGGIWKSSDGGDTWKKLEGGLPSGLLGRIGIAVSPVNPNRLWAIVITPDDATSGLYRSEDAGETWSRVCRDHRLQQRGWYYSHVTADPKNENTVYVNNVDFLKSIDGGKTFEEINVPHGDCHGVWLNPDNPQLMAHCNDGGATVSLNGGKTWTDQHNQATSEFYRVTVDEQFPYRLYAGQQDNSTISIPSRDPGGLSNTEHWHDAGGSECADVAVSPTDPNLIWATAYSGEITIMNRADGSVRQVTAYPHYTEGTVMRDLKYRFQWNAPVLASRHQPNTVYYCSQFVHRSTDNGQTWQIISPDLSRKLDQYLVMPGGPIQHDATGVEVYSTAFVIEEAPQTAGELWVGSDDGRIHITRDAGKTWIEITPKGIIPFECTINKIELSGHAPGRALVAVQNYRNNDFKPYILLTNDYGKTWKLLTNGNNGIPNGHFARAIAEDAQKKEILYAGTEYGMYISFDEGARWQSLQLNLPHTPITDLEVHHGDLAMSTQGRGFWILEDLHVLAQLQNAQSKAGLHLYKPRDTYRSNVSGYRAVFHLNLSNDTGKDVESKVEILNGQAKVVRTYSSKGEDRRSKLSLKKGWNTLSWDLSHDGPIHAEKLVLMEMGVPMQGPPTAPGDYQVRVTVGKESKTQEFKVLPDPRWKDVKLEDYVAQEKLALEMRDLISDSQRKVKNLRSLRSQIEDAAELAVKAGHTTKIKDLATELGKVLTAVEDEIVQNQAEASQDNFNYPRRFINHLARIYSVLIWDHHRPTGGVLEAYADMKKVYEGISQRYDVAVKNTLERFNKVLEEEKVARVIDLK